MRNQVLEVSSGRALAAPLEGAPAEVLVMLLVGAERGIAARRALASPRPNPEPVRHAGSAVVPARVSHAFD